MRIAFAFAPCGHHRGPRGEAPAAPLRVDSAGDATIEFFGTWDEERGVGLEPRSDRELQLGDSLEDLLLQFENGSKRAAARVISIVEDGRPEAFGLLERLYPRLGRARRIGLTGPPGAGKSSLADRLTELLVASGESVGVVAVDPTSPFTGGALLGDRVRMGPVANDGRVFFRSLATRGSLGGLSLHAAEVADVLDAFGCAWVFLETVGVGQSELDVADKAHTTVVVLVPESGDGIQAMKSGLMEIADVFVVNKSDRAGAEKLAEEIRIALGFKEWAGWQPPIVCTEARAGRGVEALLAALRAHGQWLGTQGLLRDKRRRALESRLRDLVLDGLGRRLGGDPERRRRLAQGLDEIEAGRGSPYALARELLQRGGKVLQHEDEPEG